MQFTKLKGSLIGFAIVSLCLFSCEYFKKKETTSKGPETQGEAINFEDLYLGKFRGQPIHVSDLEDSTKNQLWIAYSGYIRVRKSALNEYAEKLYLKDLSLKNGKSTPEELRAEMLKVEEPTETEMRQLFEANKKNIPYPYEAIKTELSQHIKSERISTALKSLAQKVSEFGKIEIDTTSMEPPAFAVKTDGYPALGNTGSKFQVVEFADFSCPHCKAVSADVQKLIEENKDKMSFVFRFFPKDDAGEGMTRAKFALCSNAQGKFGEAHALLYNFDMGSSKDATSEFALLIKADAKTFGECVASETTLKAILTSRTDGKNLCVVATPTFYINGKIIRSENPVDEIRKRLN